MGPPFFGSENAVKLMFFSGLFYSLWNLQLIAWCYKLQAFLFDILHKERSYPDVHS